MEESKKINNLSINNIPESTTLEKTPILEGELTGYASIDKPWMKYYDEVARNDQIPQMSVYDYLKERNKNHGDLIAINYYGKKITYKKLIEKIDEVASSLSNIGVKEGDVVSLCMPSLPETMYTFFALNKLGAVANMIDPRIIPEQIEKFVSESNSKVLITIDAISEKINKMESNLGVEKIITVSPNNSLPIVKKSLKSFKDKIYKLEPNNFTYAKWNEFIKGNKFNDSSKAKFDKDRSAEIVYTTGTTGTPKGAILTNQNILAMINEQRFAIPQMKPGEKFLDIMPPFIAYGSLWGMIIPLMAGLEVVVIPKFDSNKFDELLLEYKPPYIMGVPSFYEGLLKSEKLKNADLSFLKCPIAGGNAMTPTSEKRVNEFFKAHNSKIKMLKGYGMTEVSSAIAFPINDEVNKIGSVGIPLSKSTVKAVDLSTLEEQPYNVKGELFHTGPTVIKGYLNNPTEQEKTFITDSNGVRWVKSGDVGYIDEDGCIFITGRSKRSIIKADGHNVYPQEIENVITMYDAVEACCCVGAPSPLYENGVIPTAYVVLKDEYKGYEPEIEKKLREFSTKYLPPREVADEYVFVDSIPLIDGKVDYRKVENWAKEKVEKEKKLKYKN